MNNETRKLLIFVWHMNKSNEIFAGGTDILVVSQEVRKLPV